MYRTGNGALFITSCHCTILKRVDTEGFQFMLHHHCMVPTVQSGIILQSPQCSNLSSSLSYDPHKIYVCNSRSPLQARRNTSQPHITGGKTGLYSYILNFGDFESNHNDSYTSFPEIIILLLS